MKPVTQSIAVVLLLLAPLPVLAVFNEGTVIAVDGKGSFHVSTTKNGILEFHANAELMADKLEFKNPAYPHLYRDIKVGDYIRVSWQGDEKTRKRMAQHLGIKKRGG